MRDPKAFLDAVGKLLAYPDGRTATHAAAALLALGESDAAVARCIEDFAAALAPLEAGEREELYTRTFDLDPDCCLEIGWHLFGESYDCGGLLVQLRAALRETGVLECGELPDHLVHVLPLLGRLEPERAARLATTKVLPAIVRLRESVPSVCPWAELLQAAAAHLEAAFGPAAFTLRPREEANHAG